MKLAKGLAVFAMTLTLVFALSACGENAGSSSNSASSNGTPGKALKLARRQPKASFSLGPDLR